MGDGAFVDEEAVVCGPAQLKNLLALVGRNGAGTWRHSQHPQCCRSSNEYRWFMLKKTAMIAQP